MLSLPLLLSLRSPWMAAIGETAKSKGQGVEFLAYNTKSVIIFDLFGLSKRFLSLLGFLMLLSNN